jgi:hypothetical protein
MKQKIENAKWQKESERDELTCSKIKHHWTTQTSAFDSLKSKKKWKREREYWCH